MPDLSNPSMLPAMLALILWTLAMLVWLYATRIPAMQAAKITPTPDANLDSLPGWARRPAANYNHLHEQPTLFYALVAYCHLAGIVDPIYAGLAWAYVGVRILHSFVQVLTTNITLRFMIFNVSALCLAAIAIRAALQAFAAG